VSNSAPAPPDPPRPDHSGSEREKGDRNGGHAPEALSLISADWQPTQDDIRAAQAARTASSQPVLTGQQLTELTRKFVRRQTGDRAQLTASARSARWQEWAERERPTPDAVQPPFLFGINGDAPRWPHETTQQSEFIPDPMQTCTDCDRAFRARQPGLCRDCRNTHTSTA
jgi:hypothetical protein